jgi:hypothetical protein
MLYAPYISLLRYHGRLTETLSRFVYYADCERLILQLEKIGR